MADNNWNGHPGFPDGNEAEEAYLPQQPRHTRARLENWQNDQTHDFHSRFLVRQYYHPADGNSGPRSVVSSSDQSDSSSMALTAFSHTTAASSVSLSGVPSLAESSSSTVFSRDSLQEPSLDMYGLEEDADGVLGLPVGRSVGHLPCLYEFLNCPERFGSLEGCEGHSKAHCTPARVQDCPFIGCCSVFEARDGETAWARLWAHIYDYHRSGFVDTGRRPSMHSIDHLLRVRAITEPQKKDLQQFGRLSSRPYVQTADHRRERRERARPPRSTGTLRVAQD